MKSPILLPNPKVTISPVGLQVTSELSFDEWSELAHHIGRAARSVGFIIGDWLVYGQGLFGGDVFPEKRVDSATYQIALAATGLDLSTLHNYAYVSRNVPFSLRSERLSWEHHRLMAKLPEGDKQEWIQACVAEEEAGRRMSTRHPRPCQWRIVKLPIIGRAAAAADGGAKAIPLDLAPEGTGRSCALEAPYFLFRLESPIIAVVTAAAGDHGGARAQGPPAQDIRAEPPRQIVALVAGDGRAAGSLYFLTTNAGRDRR